MMSQNDINKEIRVIIIQLFGEKFLEAVDSFDTYRSILKENILISDYDSIIEQKSQIDKLKEEIKEKFQTLKKESPIILTQIDKCLNEITILQKESSRDSINEIIDILNENYEEIENIVFKKIKNHTGKDFSEDVETKTLVKNIWIKSYKLTLKKTKSSNFNYFQSKFLNHKYDSILSTLVNINFY